MIPTDREDLDALAGEYVLGTLDPAQAREVAAALVTHPTLRDAVVFWEQQLHPLSALAPAADPPRDLWDGIAAQLNGAATPRNKSRLWKDPAPWRWSTAVSG